MSQAGMAMMPMMGMPQMTMMPMMMGMPMPSMKCMMTCSMQGNGMMCKMMPMQGMNMDMFKNCCALMMKMMECGMPMMMSCNGMPVMCCTC
ncbi:hypothetical protein TUM20286_57750 [Pseudomonas tohonis]|nr:hypothetical protein TUM20286_57750 [Pseudomonas tohonis]